MLNENTNLNNFTYKGINSLDMGLFVTSKTNVYGGAKPVLEVQNIPAKGNVIIDNKADTADNEEYEDFQITYSCCVAADEGIDIDIMAKHIWGWLYTDIAYSELYDTYDNGYYRMAYIDEQMSVEELAGRLLGGVDILFKCKAFKKDIKGDRTITITAATALVNTEHFTASPYMKIYANGNITIYINDRSHSYTGVSSYIEVDSELMNCYKGDTLQNSKMTGDKFPKLTAGVNNISWVGSVSKIEIKPRWCSL